MKAKKVKCPVDRKDRGRGYLTKNKVYDILPDPYNYHSHRSFEILSDDGVILYCLFEDCSHINKKNWIQV